MVNEIELTTENYEQIVSKGITIVDFRADWCAPCRMMDSVLEKVAEDPSYKNVKFGKVNVDKNMELNVRHSISGIPTFLFYKDGEIIDRSVGLQTKNTVKSMLNSSFNK